MAIQISKFVAGSKAPSNEKALNSSDRLCTVCGRALGNNPWFFEASTAWEIMLPMTNEKDSQGFFPVGNECAKSFDSILLVKAGA